MGPRNIDVADLRLTLVQLSTSIEALSRQVETCSHFGEAALEEENPAALLKSFPGVSQQTPSGSGWLRPAVAMAGPTVTPPPPIAPGAGRMLLCCSPDAGRV